MAVPTAEALPSPQFPEAPKLPEIGKTIKEAGQKLAKIVLGNRVKVVADNVQKKEQVATSVVSKEDEAAVTYDRAKVAKFSQRVNNNYQLGVSAYEDKLMMDSALAIIDDKNAPEALRRNAQNVIKKIEQHSGEVSGSAFYSEKHNKYKLDETEVASIYNRTRESFLKGNMGKDETRLMQLAQMATEFGDEETYQNVSAEIKKLEPSQVAVVKENLDPVTQPNKVQATAESSQGSPYRYTIGASTADDRLVADMVDMIALSSNISDETKRKAENVADTIQGFYGQFSENPLYRDTEGKYRVKTSDVIEIYNAAKGQDLSLMDERSDIIVSGGAVMESAEDDGLSKAA